MAESNQVKWRGIRNVSPVVNIQTSPGIFETTVSGVTRTHIAKSAEVNNTTTVLHVVAPGKIFYLCGFTVCINGGANKITHLEVRNVANAIQYILSDVATAATAAICSSLDIKPPIPIAAGFDIALETTNAHAAAFIHGWEQDA